MAAPSLAKAESISDRPATPTRKQRKAGEPSGSASQPQLASPLKDMDRKPVTKVSIRWLPVDLPEHVFWRSVEPALPWFDPQNVGSLVQKERTVLRELCTHFETVSTDVEATLDQVETEGDAQAPMAADDLPSSKGATTTTMFDVYESQNLVRLDSEPYWRAFVPGKQHRSKAKPADPARAYILFATPAEVDHFYKNYHGHVFSKNGVVSRAAVELAAFQHVPWSVVSASTSDMLSGTIDEDPDFIAFLAMDPNAADDGVKGDAATAEGVKPLSHMSYAAAASSSSANAKSEGDTAAETTTPLINYLRELKGMPAARSSAKSPASTPNRSGDVTPKKARRRNR
ncbi:hypothetical protein GGI20_003004 [Coemansia sp. BCRC 34301]|nr:hypothetical protein GGI20_003004 [Coemansia sp. BCRC 34301]